VTTAHPVPRRHAPARYGAASRTAGPLLRLWRERRRLSQLELSSRAEVSTRHLSFVETGRAVPSREMLLRLADHLEIPLRDRNALLLAGGYAPVYPETALDAPAMRGIAEALRVVLDAYDPFPAVVVDRKWDLVDANRNVDLLTAAAAPVLLEPPVNVLRLSLSPDGVAPAIVNLGEWRAHILGRLRRQVEATGDPELADLFEELRAYPCDDPEPDVEVPGAGEVVLPLRLRRPDGSELAFFSVVSTLGTPLDVTAAELVLEGFFPADEATAAVLRGGHASHGGNASG
jgi:transcriptional regulator with XRE-family HTH domain